MPKVSFIVAVYNVGQYIQECVRSLYAQTLDDIEVVLVDDCSPDNSIELAMQALEDYPARKDQVKVVRHSRNMGLPQARHTGVDAATGDYVMFIDGDDYIDTELGELMYLQSQKDTADHVFCCYLNFTPTSERFMSIVRQDSAGNTDKLRDDVLNRVVVPFLVGKLTRRELFYSHDIIWPTCNMGEDSVLSPQLAYWAKKITHITQAAYHYRTNPQSLSNGYTADLCVRRRNEFSENIELYIRFLEREGVEEKYWYGILSNKLRAKNRLLPVVGNWKYRKMWLDTYPEVNKTVFWGDKNFRATYHERLWFLIVLFGFYPIIEKHRPNHYYVPHGEWI